MSDVNIFEATKEEFKAYLDSLNSTQLSDFMMKMNRSQRKIFLDNLTNDQIKYYRDQLPQFEKEKFMDRIGKDGVYDYLAKERELLLQGRCTRDWTEAQQIAILERRNPTYIVDGKEKPFEGHHMLSKEEYPKYAANGYNIQALTFEEHRASGTGIHSIKGGTSVPVSGLIETSQLPVSLYEITFTDLNKGYPPQFELSNPCKEVLESPLYSRTDYTVVLSFYDELDLDAKIKVQKLEHIWKTSEASKKYPDFFEYILNNGSLLNKAENNTITYTFSETLSENILRELDDIDVSEYSRAALIQKYPMFEFADDGKVIQFLNRDEHIDGAHAGKSSNETLAFYDGENYLGVEYKEPYIDVDGNYVEGKFVGNGKAYYFDDNTKRFTELVPGSDLYKQIVGEKNIAEMVGKTFPPAQKSKYFPSTSELEQIFDGINMSEWKDKGKFYARVGIAEYRRLGIDINATHIKNNPEMANYLKSIGDISSELSKTTIYFNEDGIIDEVIVKLDDTAESIRIVSSSVEPSDTRYAVTALEYKRMNALTDESVKLRYSGSQFDALSKIEQLKLKNVDALFAEKNLSISLDDLDDISRKNTINNLWASLKTPVQKRGNMI